MLKALLSYFYKRIFDPFLTLIDGSTKGLDLIVQQNEYNHPFHLLALKQLKHPSLLPGCEFYDLKFLYGLHVDIIFWINEQLRDYPNFSHINYYKKPYNQHLEKNVTVLISLHFATNSSFSNQQNVFHHQ